jgi:pimeloyl-ACP methyl ester carboxylesterase
MSTITTKDGTDIYYKDWGTGPVVTFSHGWPLNADAWDGQMLFLVQNGYRCVALDRRGHGRSSQASAHNDMDGYADDLAAVIEALDLREATLVGHSTGGGEVARYIGRHGTKRVKKAETDFTEDLKKFDVPTLVLHGEDDQIVPVKDSAKKSARLIKGAKEIYYPGAPHGLTATHQDQVNADLLAFIAKEVKQSAA